MLPFADRKLYAEHKLKGGGVPSPEGLQLNNYRMCALRITLEDPVFVLFNCLPFSFLIIATFIVNTDESEVHPYCISLR